MRKARRFRKPAEEEGEYVVANEGRSASFERIFEEDFVRNDRTTERPHRLLFPRPHQPPPPVFMIFSPHKPPPIFHPPPLPLPPPLQLPPPPPPRPPPHPPPPPPP